MKVTLIYVGIGVAGFNPNRPVGDREGSWISHGVASIGAYAKKEGYDVDLIDMRQLSGFDELEKIIIENPSDVYGISVSPVDYAFALQTILIIKKNLKSKVIVGGIHPTIFPGEYDFSVIDCVVQGEGEVTFVELLKKIELGEPLPRTIRGEKPDLNKIPYVDRELFDYERELSCVFAPDQLTPSVTAIAGRGCPFKCTYCQPAENAVFGHPYRMRNAERVVSELELLKSKYDFKSVTFWDDTFTFNTKWVRDFCDLYEQSKINAPIAACSRADIICNNEGMIERLSEIGLDWFVIGFETGSQRLLDLIKKGTTVEQNIKAAKICRKYGIKIFGTFMYGLPTETEDETRMTKFMIKEINPDHSSPFWFIPIKGTEIYNLCESKDLILDGDRSPARTGIFTPSIKGINYNEIERAMI